MPDKTAWIFSYNSADPNNPNSLADGALNNVILPTGGQVSYTYHSHLADVTTSCAQAPSFGGFGGGPVCGSSGLITSVIGSRSTNDNLGNIATWNYDIGTITYDTSPSAVGYLPRIGVSTTHGPVIQQPDGTFASNDIVDTYTGALGSGGIPMTLQKEDIYQGPAGGQNLPIETTTHSYLLTYGQTGQGYNEFVASYLPSTVSATIPGVGTSVTTTRYDASFVGSSSFIDQNCNNPPDCTDLGPENIQTATYSLPLGTVTSESVTDFNPLAVLTSTQTVPYWMTTGGTASPYYQANLINLPGSIKNLNVISGETDYAYDESNGSPQGAFGNLTTRKQFPNLGGPPLTASTVYTSQGVPSQVTVNGVVTQVNSFDCNGRYPLSTTVGFGTSIAETTLQQHDCMTGAIISSTDPNGVLTYNLYNDPLNRITQVSSAVGTNLETHTKYTYSANQVQIAQDQNAKDDGLIQTTSIMDGLGRVIKQTQPTGAAIDTHYDLIGHLSSVSNPYFTTTDPTFDLTTYTYDALGRQLLTSHASDGSSSSISYAQQGNTQSGVKTVKTDEVGVATTFYNDALGRLSSVIEPGSLLTTYQYDGLGNLRGVMEYGAAHEIPRVRGFGYDSLSRLLYSSNPETGVICYGHGDGTVPGCQPDGYDGNENLRFKTDARSIITTYSYDALNRLTRKDYSDNITPSDGFEYDGATNWGGLCATNRALIPCHNIGHLTHTFTSNYLAQNTFGYDFLGRVNLKTTCVDALCGTNRIDQHDLYDLAGNPISSEYGFDVNRQFAWGGVEYFRDAGNRLSFATNIDDTGYTLVPPSANNTLLAVTGFDPIGSTSSYIVSQGTPYSQQSARDHRMRSYAYSAVSPSNASVYNWNIGFYPNGNLSSSNDSVNGNWTQFLYDGLNRLSQGISATRAAQWQYDSFGNMLSQTLTTGAGMQPQRSYSQPTNRPDGYCFDAAGNQLGLSSCTELKYDGANRLASANSGQVSYIYYSDGTRAAKYIGGQLQNAYIYDLDGHVVTVLDPQFHAAQREAYVEGRHLGTFTGETPIVGSTPSNGAPLTLVFRDWLGTERGRADASGNLCQTTTSLPFGDSSQTVGSCSPTNTFFTGKERDAESGLDNFEARYYSSNMGRMMSPDPSGLYFADPRNPQSLNLYSYVMNNPLRYTDPTGRKCQTNSSDGNTYDDGDGQGCTTVDRQEADHQKNDPASSTAYAGANAAMLETRDALSEFGAGGAKPTINYLPNDPFTLNFQRSLGMQAINAKIKGNCSQAAGGGGVGTGEAAINSGIDHLTGQPSIAEDQLGGFTYTYSQQGGTVDVTVSNPITLNSLAYHALASGSEDVNGNPGDNVLAGDTMAGSGVDRLGRLTGSVPFGRVNQVLHIKGANPCQ